MPVEVAVADVPTFVRSGTVTKYADIFNHLTGWLTAQAAIKDPEKRVAVAYTGLTKAQLALPEDERPAHDGVDKDNWGAIASGVRRVAKDRKYKVTLVYRENEPAIVDDPTKPHIRLYVTFGGDFVPLTAEQLKQRKEKRRTNKIAALTEKYTEEGMTPANAAKRAKDEVAAMKVV
jgi:hypothetical protein